MCLSKFWDAPPEMQEGEGWKVGYLASSASAPPYARPPEYFATVDRSYMLPLNRWMMDQRSGGEISVYDESQFGFSQYRTGFHIFLTYDAAKTWKHSGAQVVKVKYRKGHTMGTQKIVGCNSDPIELPVIVADEIFIEAPTS